MAESVSFTRLPLLLEISMGNPAHSWGKWKQKFQIYLKPIGAAKKPDEMKVGLLLNHIGEPYLEIYSNFILLPERDNPTGGEDKLTAENPDSYVTIMAEFDAYFQTQDSQLMLRDKFWIHLKQEPTQTLDSWIVTVKERAAECKFPADFSEQAIRDKFTFSCKEDTYKLNSVTKEQPFHSKRQGRSCPVRKQQNVSYKIQKPQRLRGSHREGTDQTLSLIKMQSKRTSETLRESPSK